MLTYQEKLQNVTDHFKNGDTNLGYRKLIDCVLDAKNLEFYKECIELTDWKETNLPSDEELTQKVISFMVFNRMGKLVYEKQNVDPSEIRWDGKYNGVLQESDVYYWVAKISGLGTPSLSDTRGQFLLLK